MYTESPEANEHTAAAQKVPWKPWWGVVFAVLVFYGSQILAGIILTFYPDLRRWPAARANDWLNNAVTAQFAFVLMAEVGVVAAIYLFLKRHRAALSSIGLKKPRWADPLYGLAAVPAYFVLYLLTVGVVSHYVPGLNINQQQQIGFNNVQGAGELILTFISLVVLPPIAEEIMVRGFIYSSLKKAFKLWPAVILTSLIFAVAHLPEGGSAGPLYIAALDTFVLSLVLIYLREKTGSLWASITLHAIKNGIAFVALFVIHAH